MTEDWDFYFCNVDDKIASIFVDLGIASSAPVPSLSHMAYVRLFMRSAREDGLSSESEYEALIRIEDKLSEAVRTYGAGYVGRSTTAGFRDFVFYVSDVLKWQKAVSLVFSEFPEYEFEADARPDEAWSVYFSFLRPGEMDRQKIENRRVCESLERHGDLLTEPREIDYWSYFRDGTSVNAFIADASKEGFNLRSNTQIPDGEFPVRVRLWRVDVPSYSKIDEPTLFLFHLAKAHDGDFDGWECVVIKGLGASR